MAGGGAASGRARALLAGGLGVLLLSLASVHLRPEGSQLALWWPAAALSAALVVRSPTARSRAAAVLAVACASCVANVLGGRPPSMAVSFGLANGLEALAVATVLARPGAAPALRTLPDVGRLLLACAAGAATIGLTAGPVAWLLAGGDLAGSAWTLAASHGSALLLLLPMVLPGARTPGEAGVAERCAQSAALVLLTAVTFGPGMHLPLSLLPIAALVWAALRCGNRWAFGQTLLTGLAVSAATLQGWGPYAAHASQHDAPMDEVLLVQLFVLVVGCVVLATAAVVEERRAALDEVQRLASHDTLTGAGNRRLLDDRLASAVARAERGEASTLLLVDLDGFKAVNDTDGHQQGDRVLVAVADRLRTLVRPTDTVVRLGGDEFVLLLHGVAWPSPEADALCARLAAAVGEPVEGTTRRVGASTGAVAVRAGATHDALLHEADAAMYAAKSRRPPQPRAASPGFVRIHP